MKAFLAAAVIGVWAGAALAADPVEGMWKTRPDDNGNFGYVLIKPCAAAFWFKSRGKPLPGGAWYLLLVLLVAISWPVLATFIRSREIRRRKPIGEDEFLIGISHKDGSIEKHAIITLRRAIAAAYCIPVELVGPEDSRKCMNALSLMCPPLAIEIMADGCRLSDINFEIKSLRSVEHHFRDFRPLSVAQLVHHINRTMKAEGLLETK